MLINSGLIIHDPHTLGDPRLILAREWILDPIYALLDRQGPYAFLKDRHGIFRHADLERFWDKELYSQDQRELALAFMRQNGLLITDWEQKRYYLGSQQPSYILPKLLPENLPPEFEKIWSPETDQGTSSARETKETKDRVHTFNCEHGGEFILRRLQGLLGQRYGARLTYWRWGLAYKIKDTNSDKSKDKAADWILCWQLHQDPEGRQAQAHNSRR